MAEDHEDTSVGGVTWHSSEEDGGPGVGISVSLGENDRLWAGEISRRLFEDLCGPLHFDSDGGWFLIHFKPDGPELIAKFSESHVAQEFIERVAVWAREAALPTLAKTFGDMDRTGRQGDG